VLLFYLKKSSSKRLIIGKQRSVSIHTLHYHFFHVTPFSIDYNFFARLLVYWMKYCISTLFHRIEYKVVWSTVKRWEKNKTHSVYKHNDRNKRMYLFHSVISNGRHSSSPKWRKILLTRKNMKKKKNKAFRIKKTCCNPDAETQYFVFQVASVMNSWLEQDQCWKIVN
jgi:hypothetical protein